MKTVIYGLFCPLAGAIRYVGKSSEVHKRFKAHLYSANPSGKTHRQRWVAQVLAAGLKPSLVILEEVDASDWQEAERRWITQGLAQGWPLTNLSAGGDGASPLDESARAMKKKQMSSPEARANMSAAAKARWADSEKRSVALAAAQNEERRMRQSEQARKRATPEYRAMMSARSKAAWADKEKRGRIMGGITEETRRAVSDAARRMWEDGEKREKMLANLHHGSQVMADLWSSPEYREKQAETRKTQEYKLKASQGQRRRYQREGRA